MKRYITISAMAFAIGCAPKIYNTPFVNSEETVQLDFGMTKEEVLKVMSEPLFVAYGDDNKTTWVYEVRTIEVNSLMGAGGQIIPQKSSKNQKHAGPDHRLALTFEDNKLVNWMPYEEN